MLYVSRAQPNPAKTQILNFYLPLQLPGNLFRISHSTMNQNETAPAPTTTPSSKQVPSWPVQKYTLSPPTLTELLPTIQAGLALNFLDVSVEVIPACPDLRLPPFHLAAAGLSGNERIADVGGPPNLHPLPRFDRRYEIRDEIAGLMEMGGERGFVLGAGAGPFDVVGGNSELVVNLAFGKGEGGAGDGDVVNLTRVVRIEEIGEAGGRGRCVCENVPGNSTGCALMANLFGSEGRTGEVLKISAKTRTGELDFISAIQKALRERFGTQPVSLAGVFVIKKGKAKLHVMPDFSKEPLETSQVKEWLRFFEMRAPLVCLTVFHSFDPGLDLRMEHTHCFSQHGEGGHYHYDTTPEEVEYEAYLNTAKILYRIDQPAVSG